MKIIKRKTGRKGGIQYYVDYKNAWMTINDMMKLPNVCIKRSSLASRISHIDASETKEFKNWNEVISRGYARNKPEVKLPCIKITGVCPWLPGSLAHTVR